MDILKKIASLAHLALWYKPPKIIEEQVSRRPMRIFYAFSNFVLVVLLSFTLLRMVGNIQNEQPYIPRVVFSSYLVFCILSVTMILIKWDSISCRLRHILLDLLYLGYLGLVTFLWIPSQIEMNNKNPASLIITDHSFDMMNNSWYVICLLYTSPSPRDRQKSRMPSSA
eukprot:TRINITY_DN15663_c0_g1_i2.p1 TRINITY_DN15663_c0_g1~~TRINITY_DN15663_c0_g1_i2.p1  ORF type:complete len:169 (-),score=3.76 TRINITY_DN15663_c0_g1_i2:10-516(-)